MKNPGKKNNIMSRNKAIHTTRLRYDPRSQVLGYQQGIKNIDD